MATHRVGLELTLEEAVHGNISPEVRWHLVLEVLRVTPCPATTCKLPYMTMRTYKNHVAERKGPNKRFPKLTAFDELPGTWRARHQEILHVEFLAAARQEHTLDKLVQLLAIKKKTKLPQTLNCYTGLQLLAFTLNPLMPG